MLHRLCASRIHEWGPDGVCTRQGCGKIKGLRGPNAHARSAQPRPSVQPASPKPLPSRPVATGDSRLQQAAQKLAERRGFVRVVEATEGGPLAQAEVKPPSASKRKTYSVFDWFGGKIPDAIQSGCTWAVRKGGHEPYEADPVWSERFHDSFNETMGNALPNWQMPSWLAMLVAVFVMWLSMRWGAPPIKTDKDEDRDKAKSDENPRSTSPTDSTPAEGKVCKPQTANAPLNVATSVSVDATVPSPIPLLFQLPLDQPEGKSSAGVATSVVAA